MSSLRDIVEKRNLLATELEVAQNSITKMTEKLKAYDLVIKDMGIEVSEGKNNQPGLPVLITEGVVLKCIKGFGKFVSNDEIVQCLCGDFKDAVNLEKVKNDVSATLTRLKNKNEIVRNGSNRYAKWGLSEFIVPDEITIENLLN